MRYLNDLRPDEKASLILVNDQPLLPPDLPEAPVPLKNDALETPPAEPASPIRDERNSGCGMFILGSVGCLAIVGVGLIAAILLGITTIGNLIGGIGGTLGLMPVPQQARVISSETLIDSILPLGQLVSLSTEMSIVDIRVGVQQGVLNACGVAASHAAEGAIEAGIDLNAIRPEDVAYNAETNTYSLALPAPELTSCRVDFIRQYNRSFTTCAIDWDEVRTLASYNAILEFRDTSIETGILDRAQIEAQGVLTQFLTTLTGATVNITFRPPSDAETEPPSSCQPQAPPGWNFNPQTSIWNR